MAEWAPIEVADALELLSPDFKNDEVRSHAVMVLQAKDDEELLYYLLQLVQALRFEAVDLSRLARFLIGRATSNPAFATFLHWYLFTEWEDPSFGARASCVHAALVDALTGAPRGEAVWEAIRRQTDMVSQLAYIVKDIKMSRLKAARATDRLREMLSADGPCEELTAARVPLPLNPSLLLEGLVPSECACFKSAQLPVKLAYRVAPSPIDWEAPAPLAPQRPPAGSGLHGSSSSSGALGDLSGSAAFPGAAAAAGAVAPGATLGAAAPAGAPAAAALHRLPPQCRTALTVGGGGALRCVMIYKKGDDLRQDQFVLQMLSLMDRLLKRENLDLRLTPYRQGRTTTARGLGLTLAVLPTGSDDGLVEFVPSVPLSALLAEHRSIHRFLLASGQGDPQGPFGVRADALETFVRSCAGYCVMTYILGVGDRHLDNLMLAPDGRLFHIDFGYILGSDPKPFPPPMKLCKEMIEAMGGADSGLYVRFRMLACEAYNILRKSADLILSLFHLMAGASIEAIRSNPENAMLKLQEKLRLDFDDGQAVEWMQQLINESATAMMPQIMETTHRWAQYWR
ncbi:phosphatidylinositol 3-kinase [Monoraphidium neglectum]|uniref:phosphatidylinositol 3-kinase n=1 Tax=Monoraphidium neglectum TaxID=145388 RepID=A0A0D2KKZ7_9CHLO|nr:phosphatidylinositol 3-kinase [Monoraphidium neglectum]KIY96448.1 phosphatidylinositol 3-kinase [Monoraphidium neglectum]|eukprot:XP_013895468.1 phosphatidylinositol 3-kinase [Monoraphidium neglectum]